MLPFTKAGPAQVGLLVSYMLDAARQKELALSAVWITVALANTTQAIASWGHHGSASLHVAAWLATTGALSWLQLHARHHSSR